MNARCGRCGTDFAVNGPGRYPCPGCGVTNEVRAAPDAAGGGFPPGGNVGPPDSAPAGVPPPLTAAPPPGMPPAPEVPSKRVTCPSCEFSFIVGTITTATCPMCSTEVSTDLAAPGVADPESGP